MFPMMIYDSASIAINAHQVSQLHFDQHGIPGRLVHLTACISQVTTVPWLGLDISVASPAIPLLSLRLLWITNCGSGMLHLDSLAASMTSTSLSRVPYHIASLMANLLLMWTSAFGWMARCLQSFSCWMMASIQSAANLSKLCLSQSTNRRTRKCMEGWGACFWSTATKKIISLHVHASFGLWIRFML